MLKKVARDISGFAGSRLASNKIFHHEGTRNTKKINAAVSPAHRPKGFRVGKYYGFSGEEIEHAKGILAIPLKTAHHYLVFVLHFFLLRALRVFVVKMFLVAAIGYSNLLVIETRYQVFGL
ncbi:MAG: hypothetical protein L3K26_01235 [Candidatus Hydrogenedentes bacterium]|nr:hypothetical protein [Candidatus Hydrogenedentota bacterium]